MNDQSPAMQRIRSCLAAMERSIDSARTRRVQQPTASAPPVSNGMASTPKPVSSFAPPSSAVIQEPTAQPTGPVKLKAKAKRLTSPPGLDRHLPRQAG
jgi:hypothetical protein